MVFSVTNSNITLLTSITVLSGTNNIPWNNLNISHIQFECGKYMRLFHGILSVSQNNIMDLNNVMNCLAQY